MTKIPESFQGILWSRNVSNLDLDLDKNYIINQLLAYGSLTNLKWLFKTYTISDIKKIFKKYPSKDYTKKSFNFVKNILLDEKENIDEKKYVKSYPRII